MKQQTALEHEFVDFIPDELKERTLYVCIRLATVVHKCCCGCGNEVVTPLSPTDWRLTFDGETITLHPSIGNWGFACRSHYWIVRNKVTWARRWSQKEIESGRSRDRLSKQKYFHRAKTPTSNDTNATAGRPKHDKSDREARRKPEK